MRKNEQQVGGSPEIKCCLQEGKPSTGPVWWEKGTETTEHFNAISREKPA